MKQLLRVGLAALMSGVLAVAAACDKNETDTTTTPTEPTTVTSVTETFTGTLSVGQKTTHAFAVGGAGTVTFTLMTLEPDPALVVGMSAGVWIESTSTCTTVLQNDNAGVGTILTGITTAAVNLCVRVYDVGNLTEDAPTTNYTIQVVHP